MKNIITIIFILMLTTNSFPILPRIKLKYNVRKATTSSGISYGNYDDSVYNSLRNEYFWKDNSYLQPIYKQDSIKIAWFWNNGQINENIIYEKHYHSFITDINNPEIKCYKWIPSPEKEDICGLINCYLDKKNKKIAISSILERPYHDDKEKNLLISDLNQLTLFHYYKENFRYNI